jgi:hypothetical protein
MMAKIEIFKNEQMSVYYMQEEKIIYHVMHGQVEGQPFRDAILAATDALMKNKACKWLSDDRLNPALKQADQKWSLEVWQPKVLKAGWKFWAIILPEDAVGKLRMSIMGTEYAKLGVKVNAFSSLAEGIKWLNSFKI